MSRRRPGLWARIRAALERLAPGEALSGVFERLRAPPERSVAFTIAIIALGAKMAKADGRVTTTEVAAFREVFTIAPSELGNAARVFDLARTDVAGYEDYARRIARLFADDAETLCDVMEGLFHIAVADGAYHPSEDAFLRRVADIFAVPDRDFRALRARFAPGSATDSYDVLGVTPDTPMEQVRAAWRRAVRDGHPDRLIARGLPPEAVRLAEQRLIAVNRAWETIRAQAA